ncbi:sensor domain-containing diguanylate cyclase [Pseudomonas sp. USHLN015]|uniref:sensor domain-containing diguanylate cyclase n=1 Tax=Pseudomonas sp. USHLN015 TaxID=3081296 RepID=UPI00301D74C8
MENLLSLLSETVPEARTVEQLTRPLLTLLSRVTGMESTYLTTIDLDAGTQRVEFARNTGEMEIPEGLSVPWDDTLCKRALTENRLFSNDVSECWGDSDAARALGIRTYASAPLRARDGRLLGTICAASSNQIEHAPEVQPTLMLLSGLLSISLEREMLVEQLQSSNAELARLALTDALTGLWNRRAILAEIPRLLALAQREERYLLVGVVDLDGFKAINDTHGHQAGDLFLALVARKLQGSLRTSDMLGRTGGDEFIVVALGPRSEQLDLASEMLRAAEHLQQRLAGATLGHYDMGGGQGRLDYAGASVGVVALLPHGIDAEEAIRRADREMYRIKQQRKRDTTLTRH